MKLLKRLVSIPVLAAATVLFGAVFGVLRFSDVCRLESISIDGRRMEVPAGFSVLVPDAPVFNQRTDLLAQSILGKRDIYRVSVGVSLPGTIAIATNGFTPVAIAVDQPTGQLYGLIEGGLAVPFDASHIDWNQPVMTSLAVPKPYRQPTDHRVAVVLPELKRLNQTNRDLYRLIEEIDFGNDAFLRVTVSGLPFRVRACAETFGDDLLRFVEFISKYRPDLDSVSEVDMRFANMIVSRSI